MRLLKLLSYLALGYLVYEFIQGLVYGPPSTGQSAGSRSPGRATREEARRANMSGPGQGMSQRTEDTSGGSAPHRVGRGVIRS